MINYKTFIALNIIIGLCTTGCNKKNSWFGIYNKNNKKIGYLQEITYKYKKNNHIIIDSILIMNISVDTNNNNIIIKSIEKSSMIFDNNGEFISYKCYWNNTNHTSFFTIERTNNKYYIILLNSEKFKKWEKMITNNYILEDFILDDYLKNKKNNGNIISFSDNKGYPLIKRYEIIKEEGVDPINKLKYNYIINFLYLFS